MTTTRRFCRFSKLEDTTFGMSEVPEGGLCLSAFVIINEAGRMNSVLMGHLNPAAEWDNIGALDKSRVAAHSRGWMLPSSHLIVKESPQEAAKRILMEQLELPELELSEPVVVSEVYRPRRFQNLTDHWDFEFIFRGVLSREKVPKPFAWNELKFVDLSKTKKEEIARSHEDILESAGQRLG